MTNKENKIKLSVSLDKEVVDLIDDFAKTFSMTRSSALNELMVMSMPQLYKIINEFNGFVSGIDKDIPLSQDQLDMFAGRVFRGLFGTDDEK